jgi:cobalt-zinc-cadmium efflux system membrane fusion protein
MNRHVSLADRSTARSLPRGIQFALVGGVGLLAALIAGVGLNAVHGGEAATKQLAAAQPPPGTFRATERQWAGLKTVPVSMAVFRDRQDTDGKIALDDDTTTPVFSPYSGRVTKVFVKAGDRVESGTPLFAVQASEYVQGQNDLVTALASLNTARAQLRLAETAEQRQHQLFDAKGGALKDWQQAQLDLANAQGSLRSAEIAVASTRNRLRILGKSDAEIRAIESTPDAGRFGSVALVTAPIGGTVIQRQIGIGQYIGSSSGGGTQVFAIGDLSMVWLVGNLREADAGSARLGQAVEVRVPAYPDRVFRATLTYVAPSIDPNTRRLAVRAEVENADRALKPEMFAQFSIMTGGEATAMAIPEEAIVYEGNAARVWVAGDDKTIALRRIRPGRSRDGLVEVASGLEPGETVVTSGALFIDRAAKAD